MAVLVAASQAFHGVFHDEGDILTVGWLLTKGQVLYQDIFSHHFPLPYFWSAAVTQLFGQSLIAQRLAILALTTGTFWLAQKITQRPLLVSMQFLLYALFNHLVRGNMVLYHTFASLGLYIMFVLVMQTPGENISQKSFWLNGFLFGFAGSAAVLGSVIYIYPVLIAFGFFLVTATRTASRENRFPQIIRLLWPIAAGALLLPLMFGFYLLANQAFGDFWREAIRFNLDYYSPHIDSNSMSPLQILYYIVTLHNPLQVLAPPLNPNWTLNYVLFFTIRLTALAAVAHLAVHRQFTRAAFTFVFLAALLVRNNGPNGQPYLLITLYLLGLMFTFQENAFPQKGQPTSKLAHTRKIALWITRLGLLSIISAIFLRLAVNMAANLKTLTPSANFGNLWTTSEEIQQLVSPCPNTELLAYPFDFYLYYFTEIEPASRYIFMMPWIDDYATPEIITTLAEDRPILVSYDLERFYYRPQALLDYLEQAYTPISEQLWLSPALEKCLSDQVKNILP